MSRMDVDLPASLKRSSSAPMINELTTTMSTASTSTPTRDTLPFNLFSSEPRTRRFSASFSPVHSGSSSGPPRFTPRVSQLRQEECVDVAGREAAHERDTFSAMQMSQSWEDLRLVPDETKPEALEAGRADVRHLAQRVLDPLHLNLPSSPPVCSSPSPTRAGLGRQCFSPGLHLGMPYWKSSLSPSPTRKAFATRRSLSPIAMRPSSLGQVKRKFELDEDKVEHYLSPPAKRPSYGSYGGLLMAHSNRFDTTSSPLPGSLSSVGTPESVSSADSPGFTFRPVDSPSPGRSMLTVTDEPMNEERSLDVTKQDQVMCSVDQSTS